MVTSLKNIVLIILAGAVLIPATTQAETLVTCPTPLTVDSASNGEHATRNTGYIKRINKIITQQHALDHWARPFLTARGFNYDNVDIVTMHMIIKHKYPDFFKKYLTREKEISNRLLVAIDQFGIPTSGAVGVDAYTSALWLASRATDGKDLTSLSKIFLRACKDHFISCEIIPIVKDRVQFITNGTQAYGTLPNVVIQPAVKSLADLNIRRDKFQVRPVPAVCFKKVSGS